MSITALAHLLNIATESRSELATKPTRRRSSQVASMHSSSEVGVISPLSGSWTHAREDHVGRAVEDAVGDDDALTVVAGREPDEPDERERGEREGVLVEGRWHELVHRR
jgi:hypothetical protein